MPDIIKEVSGPKDIIADLRRLTAEFPSAVEEAMRKEVAAVEAESEYECPFLTGALRRSRDASVEVHPGYARAMIWYAIEYALPVHERLEVYHAPPTKAKFLEDPARRRMAYGYFWRSLHERTLQIIRGGA